MRAFGFSPPWSCEDTSQNQCAETPWFAQESNNTTEALHPQGFPELMHRPGICMSSTLQDVKPWSTAAKALLPTSCQVRTPDRERETGMSANRNYQRSVLPRCVPVYTHQVPPTGQKVPSLSFWPLPSFKSAMNNWYQNRTKCDGSTAPLQKRAWEVVSPSTVTWQTKAGDPPEL